MSTATFVYTAVSAALRLAGPDVATLPHVVEIASSYLDVSSLWDLEKAIEGEYLRLVSLVAASLHRNKILNQWRKQYTAQRGMVVAARNGMLDVMKELFASCHCELDKRMVAAAALGRHFDIAKWLYAHANLDSGYKRTKFLSFDAVSTTTFSGDLEFLQLIFNNSTQTARPVVAQRVLKHACTSRNLVVVKRILYEEPIVAITASFDVAAGAGQLDIVHFLHNHAARHRLDACTTDAMEAASNGYIYVLKFLLENRNEGCTKEAMDQAACNGHFEVVRFLHEHRTEGCTKKAMDKAATHGHLDIVRFLHENRSEGCSTRAMDGAAAHGHLDVLKFLHANRSEGCTKDAMRIAATRNFIDVVEWLHANTNAHCYLRLPRIAAKHGSLQVLRWLHDNSFGGFTDFVIFEAARMGHFDVVKFLFENRTEGKLQDVLSIAAQLGHLNIVEWLQENTNRTATPQ